MPRADMYSAFRSNRNWHKRPGRPPRDAGMNGMQKITDEQIAAALNVCDGIIKDAAVKLKTSYDTIAPRVSRTPILRQLCEIYRNRAFDFTETHLRKANKKGEQWAIKEMLKYRGSLHGYTEKLQQELSGSIGLVNVESIESLTDEALDALIVRLDKRIAALAREEEPAQACATQLP